jgi:DNA-binding MarR family transcriptional regulator
MADTTTAGQTAVSGQQLLPLIDHLARVGRRATDCMSGYLRPRHMIALKLLGERGPMTQHAVGIALSLDPSNVVGLLNELEERGLITRRRDPADRRRHIVELSAAGSGEVALTYDQLGAVEDDLFKALTASERATLHDLLSRAVEALAPVDDAPGCAAPEPAGCQAPKEEHEGRGPSGGRGNRG